MYARSFVTGAIAVLCLTPFLLGQDGAAKALTPESVLGDADTLWTCLAAFLVFFMQAGFALVEAGLTRAKNVCNILMKNLMDFSVGSVLFWAVGFGLMFGVSNGFFGSNGFFFNPAAEGGTLGTESTPSFSWAFLMFQTVFCATAATIVSGAMAERTRFAAYLVYSVAVSALIYPVFGSWAWGGLYAGGGWLENLATPFYDFAGSTVVHSVGAWAALAGVIVLGPRIGKYTKDGKVNAIPGHNIPLAALGTFILWLGWFGFNPGSTTAVGGGNFAYIAVTTNMAAACGSIGGMLCSWFLFKKPDTSFALNGALAGLVAITAGCDAMSVPFAALTGLAAGVLVVLSVMFFDRIRVDDPVGAISVHGICGVWGTFAVGLFKTEGGLLLGGGAGQVISQLIGIGTAFAWTFPTCLILFYAIKMTVGLRVSEEEEIQGLDLSEHGMEGYPLPRDGATSPAGSPLMGGAGAAVAKPRPAHAES